MEPTLIVSVVVAVLTGGFATEVIRTIRDRKKSDFEIFYPTWKEEIERLHREIRDLQAMVLGLSSEVQRLGGDPLAIRYGATRSFDQDDQSEKRKPS